MVEPKLNLNITLPGRVMLSKEECLKTTQTKKTDKRGHTKVKEILVPDTSKFNVHSIKVSDYRSKPETLYITTRKCKEAHQSINISKESYLYMIGKDSCFPPYKMKNWARMNKKERLEAHLQNICDELGGVSYNYQVFED